MIAFVEKCLAILFGIPIVLVMLVVLLISHILSLLQGDSEDDPHGREF